MRHNNKILGASLLVVGTTMGGSMLALPAVVAGPGFLISSVLFVGCWLVMTIAAFAILEVNLLYPKDYNLISMTYITLGKNTGYVTSIIYLLLLYTLLSSYFAAIADVIHLLVGNFIMTAHWLDVLLAVLLLGLFLLKGIVLVDKLNRILMFSKLILFITLCISLFGLIQLDNLLHFDISALPGTTMVVITSFGYAIIVPTIRKYLNSDIGLIRKSMLIGSILPLLLYLLWVVIIIGVIPLFGENGLATIASSPHSVAKFLATLVDLVNSTVIRTVASAFTTLCVITSFFGISLSLVDFLQDGFSNILQLDCSRLKLILLAILPPGIIVSFYPKAFMWGFFIAGYFTVYLLIVLPLVLVWISRYSLQQERQYLLFGGKSLLIVTALLSLSLIIIAALG